MELRSEQEELLSALERVGRATGGIGGRVPTANDAAADAVEPTGRQKQVDLVCRIRRVGRVWREPSAGDGSATPSAANGGGESIQEADDKGARAKLRLGREEPCLRDGPLGLVERIVEVEDGGRVEYLLPELGLQPGEVELAAVRRRVLQRAQRVQGALLAKNGCKAFFKQNMQTHLFLFTGTAWNQAGTKQEPSESCDAA